ncbi:hypothetical protein [Xylanimonas protaetiae]|uniref:Uncharacterized protein n=1 Tax=Xylanimonas protaetiae TaxID=2509457 RepID=A0A4P6F1B9_9MICO|nr:hypothetical protein [Xylanimonas protaetiae]QAY69254.1 hypothetical protein ET471_03715 [Xylanimonas protaetiae]
MRWSAIIVRRRGLTGVEAATDRAVKGDLNGAAVDAAYLANTLRKGFFYFALAAVGLTPLARVALMGFYVWSEWNEVVPGVVIAWFSANVVQMLGLAYIMARHLYPNGANGSAATTN